MGTFYTKCKLENVTDRTKSIVLPRLLVDTKSEYAWAPAQSLEKIRIDREKKDVLFVMANGQQVTRSVGFAIIRLDKHFTIDEVVFAERGDLLSLGASSLEGLNLTVDSRRKKLVAAGPLPVAATLSRVNP
jgi:predicted aspartyl protease